MAIDPLSGILGASAKQAQNFFKGRKPEGSDPNTPNDFVPEPDKSASIQPPKTEEKGIGQQFLDNILSNPQQQQPTQEQPISLNPEDVVNNYKQKLLENNFKDNPSNLQKLIDQNPDMNNVSDFTGLDIQDEEVVPPLKKSIDEAIGDLGVMQVLSGLKKPLDIISEGLSRYEAAKVALLTQSGIAGPVQAGPEIGKALQGKSISKFPDAGLKTTKQTDMGDLLRQLGLPEAVSATGGLVLDLLTDIPVGLAAGLTLPKTTLKGIDLIKSNKFTDDVVKGVYSAGKKFGMENKVNSVLETLGKGRKYLEGKETTAENELEAVGRYLKNKMLQFRSHELSQNIIDAAKGKGRLDDLPPLVKQAARAQVGEFGAYTLDAGSVYNSLNKALFNAKEDIIKTVNKAWMGDANSFAKVDPATKVLIQQGRKLADDSSRFIVNELRQLEQTDPKLFQNIIDKASIKEGRELPADALIQTIIDRLGEHSRRSFRLFNDKINFKPNAEAWDGAIKGLLDDEVVKTETEARVKLQSILDSKSLDLAVQGKKQPLRVDTTSFIKRQDIPDYLRKFMGEIEDPAYNMYKTVTINAKTGAQLRFFRNLRESGMLSDIPTDKLSHQLNFKKGNSNLAFAGIENKYTSKEIHDYLQGVQKVEDAYDDILLNAASLLKFSKVVPNVKSSVRNVLGNVINALITGIDPISHFKLYFGKDGALDVIRAAIDFKHGKIKDPNHPLVKQFREMVKNGLVENELPNADNLVFMENLKDVFTEFSLPQSIKTIEHSIKYMSDVYAAQDQFFKIAHYMKYRKEGMSVEKAVEKVYEDWPNYREAAKLADVARQTPLGTVFLNPFITFRLERHRNLLNQLKDPVKRAKLGLLAASTGVANIALLGLAGNSFRDIYNVFQTKPEVLTDVVLNPVNKDFDLNLEYMDPYNKKGIFAPLMAAAGINGVNPLDYILGFTQFSPEFGYSNLFASSLEGGITGKGQFGQELDLGDRLQSLMKGLGPTSFTSDIPKILNPNQPSVAEDNQERIRRAFKFFGIDVEKRNPEYIKQRVGKVVLNELRKGNEGDVASVLKAVKTLGFDPDKMLKSATDKLVKEKKTRVKPPTPKNRSQEDLMDSIIKNFGLGGNNA